MQAKKHWILAGFIAAAALACGLSCRTGTPSSAKKKKYAEPISASVQVRSSPSRIAFMLQLQDVNGKKLSGIMLPNGKRPPAPKVTIADADGNEVHTFSMRYG